MRDAVAREIVMGGSAREQPRRTSLPGQRGGQIKEHVGRAGILRQGQNLDVAHRGSSRTSAPCAAAEHSMAWITDTVVSAERAGLHSSAVPAIARARLS